MIIKMTTHAALAIMMTLSINSGIKVLTTTAYQEQIHGLAETM